MGLNKGTKKKNGEDESETMEKLLEAWANNDNPTLRWAVTEKSMQGMYLNLPFRKNIIIF